MRSINARLKALLVVAVIGMSLLVPALPAMAIIGGTETNSLTHPYFVRVFQAGVPCGGSMIAQGFALTAAHCVDDVDGDINEISVFINLEHGFRPATSLQIHPLWNGDVTDGHDLAVVRFSTAGLPTLSTLRVGAPADPGAYAGDTPAQVVAQGFTNPDGGVPPVPHELNTVLRSDDFMDDVYNPWYWVDNWPEIHAIGAGSNDHTICEGDSGSPLTVTRNGVKIQVGVASFVETFPDHCRRPGGFAQLSGAQLAWVASKVPSIKTGWGSCWTSSGAPGQWYAFYQSWYSAGAPRDGSFYWNIYCGALPTTTTTLPGATTTTTIAGPPPPSDSVCMKKPWTPGC